MYFWRNALNVRLQFDQLRELGGKRSNPSPNISIVFDGKTHSSPKAIARAINRQFTARSAQQDRAIRRLMRNLHHHRRVDPSYRPFDERGVAAAIMKARSSTAQGPDGVTMLHLRHLSPHGLAFLPKILSVTLDTHFPFGPHALDCVERATRAFNVRKVLAGSSRYPGGHV